MAFWNKWFKKDDKDNTILELLALNEALSQGYVALQSKYEINKNQLLVWLGATALQYGSGTLKLKKDFIEVMCSNPNIQLKFNNKDNGDMELTIIEEEKSNEPNSNNSI